jgi:hypothetical protein
MQGEAIVVLGEDGELRWEFHVRGSQYGHQQVTGQFCQDLHDEHFAAHAIYRVGMSCLCPAAE